MSRDYWMGMLIGAIVGVGVGMLLAPGSGYDSRRKITRVAKSAGGRVADVATSVQSKAQQAVTSIKQAM